jgi:hypothetical protein
VPEVDAMKAVLQTLIITAAIWVAAIAVLIATSGCGEDTSFVALPVPTPTPGSTP